jgi:SepF-like predicted cell division protein (DUF552 family)
MGAFLAILLGLMVTLNGDVNTVEGKENNKEIESKDKENKIKLEDMEAYKTIKAKLPSYTSEEILCSLADSMWDVSEHNKILNKLKDVDIQLSGKVNRVRNNFIDGCYIVFTQKRADSAIDGWGMITCYVKDDSQIEKVMKLNKGDNITLIGHCGKYPVTGLSLYNCYIK